MKKRSSSHAPGVANRHGILLSAPRKQIAGQVRLLLLYNVIATMVQLTVGLHKTPSKSLLLSA